MSTDNIPMHCDCQMPEDSNMVQCSECEHAHCVDVPEVALENSKEPWYCKKMLIFSLSLSFHFVLIFVDH